MVMHVQIDHKLVHTGVSPGHVDDRAHYWADRYFVQALE